MSKTVRERDDKAHYCEIEPAKLPVVNLVGRFSQKSSFVREARRAARTRHQYAPRTPHDECRILRTDVRENVVGRASQPVWPMNLHQPATTPIDAWATIPT